MYLEHDFPIRNLLNMNSGFINCIPKSVNDVCISTCKSLRCIVSSEEEPSTIGDSSPHTYALIRDGIKACALIKSLDAHKAYMDMMDDLMDECGLRSQHETY